MSTLTAEQTTLVKDTWSKIKSTVSMDDLGRDLFIRLFQLDPAALQLFSFRNLTAEERKTSDDLVKHGQNFLRYVDLTVEALDDFDRLGAPKIRALGARHSKRGVKMAHFDVVGLVLEDTLGAYMGKDFTDSVRVAWVLMYGLIRTTMLEGYQAQQEEHK